MEVYGGCRCKWISTGGFTHQLRTVGQWGGPHDATCMPYFGVLKFDLVSKLAEYSTLFMTSAVHVSCQVLVVHSALILECVKIWYLRGIGAIGWFPTKSSRKICDSSINQSKRENLQSSSVCFSWFFCSKPSFMQITSIHWISMGSPWAPHGLPMGSPWLAPRDPRGQDPFGQFQWLRKRLRLAALEQRRVLRLAKIGPVDGLMEWFNSGLMVV